MPRLVRTLNQIMREERKDVYFVHFLNADDWSSDDEHARLRLLTWLKLHLPATHVEPIMQEGMLEGPCADIRIDFDEAGLAKFCAKWEEPDGKRLDPHFQCYLRPFDWWHANIADGMPTFERPESTVACTFWDTPKGFLHHAACVRDDESSGCPLIFDTAERRDVWFLAGELVPEWRDVDMAEFVGGSIYYDQKSQTWQIHVGFSSRASDLLRNDKYRADPENQRRLCEWFRLPLERVGFYEWWDF